MKKIKKINRQNNVDNILFKCSGNTKKVRKKAFVGALVSGITNGLLAYKNSEEEDKRFQEQLELQKQEISKNELYGKLQGNIQQQLIANQNNELYSKLREAKFGGKIKCKKCGGKIRRKGEYGLLSSYVPLQPATLGQEQIKLNLPTTSSVSTGGGNFDMSMLGTGVGAVLDSGVAVFNNLVNNAVTDKKYQHQNILNKLQNDSKRNSINSAFNPTNNAITKDIIAKEQNNIFDNRSQLDILKRRRGQLNSLYFS